MSLALDVGKGRRNCFPRVSGDEPGIASTISGVWEFSPRERG